MEEQLRLEDQVYSESSIIELLGVTQKTLHDLRRERGFPAVRLTARARVYLADEVLAWLKQRGKR